MEDLAAYNDGCKAVSLLITILAKVVIYRLLTRGRPWITKHTHTHTHTHTHIHTHTLCQRSEEAPAVAEILVSLYIPSSPFTDIS